MDNLTTIKVELHPWPIHDFLLLTQGPFSETLVKKFSELVDMKNWLFLKQQNSNIQNSKKLNFFAPSLFKCLINSWVALIWFNFFAYFDFQRKIRGDVIMRDTLYTLEGTIKVQNCYNFQRIIKMQEIKRTSNISLFFTTKNVYVLPSIASLVVLISPRWRLRDSKVPHLL